MENHENVDTDKFTENAEGKDLQNNCEYNNVDKLPKEYIHEDTKAVNFQALIDSFVGIQENSEKPLSVDDTQSSTDLDVYNRLSEIGLTEDQISEIEKLAPELIEHRFVDVELFDAYRQLEEHFGGRDKWVKICDDIDRWSSNNLDENVKNTLATSVDGIVAMHKMMTEQEPNLMGSGAEPVDGLDEDSLFELMRNPKYWRDHDPAFVDTVTNGFKKLYG